MKVAWTRPAARDLDLIGNYIARDNPRAAERVVKLIVGRSKELAAHPHLGRPGRVPHTRELVIPATRFIVVYRIGDEAVEILAVFHGARKWPDAF